MAGFSTEGRDAARLGAAEPARVVVFEGGCESSAMMLQSTAAGGPSGKLEERKPKRELERSQQELSELSTSLRGVAKLMCGEMVPRR